MKSINRCTFLGRVGKEVNLSYTKAGTAYLRFSVACSEKLQGQKRGLAGSNNLDSGRSISDAGRKCKHADEWTMGTCRRKIKNTKYRKRWAKKDIHICFGECHLAGIPRLRAERPKAKRKRI